MKKVMFNKLKVNPENVLSREKLKSIVGSVASTATLNCSNGSSITVHHSTCSNQGEMNHICYHSGGPGTVPTSCS